ncbi:MAG: hypothetical protein P1P86_09300 [Bacteroidales bacterium]|nr:hypothetical protein [Bacteroidales bacterium]
MTKKKRNSIDLLIENLAQEFAKIPNFSLTQTGPEANRLFNFILKKASEINDFKGLFLQYYIPATNKAIVLAKKEMRNSFYKNLIQISEDELKENHYEIIRLGYVGLFTKIENFHKELIAEIDAAFNNENGDLELFVYEKFNYKVKNWHWDWTVKRINWISNRVKHNGGYPNEDPPIGLKHLPKEQKIRISKEEFSKDLEYVATEYFKLLISIYSTFGMYKMIIDNSPDIEDEDEFKVKIKEFEESILKLTSFEY